MVSLSVKPDTPSAQDRNKQTNCGMNTGSHTYTPCPRSPKLAEHVRWRPAVTNNLGRARKFTRVTMNNQGAFDTALLHLLNQGHRCVSASGRSLLRSPQGGKNAIGALIPDQLYQKSMEGKTVQQLLAAAGPDFDP